MTNLPDNLQSHEEDGEARPCLLPYNKSVCSKHCSTDPLTSTNVRGACQILNPAYFQTMGERYHALNYALTHARNSEKLLGATYALALISLRSLKK